MKDNDVYTITGDVKFVAGVAVGKLVEKIKRFISQKEDEEHEDTQKSNRR